MMASLANSAIDQGSGSPLTSLTRNIAERLPDFKDPIPESWKCPLPDCGKVVVQAKQTNCGHRVCGSCVEKAFESGAESVPCPLADIPSHGCDECSSGWIKKEIFPDNYARKQVMKLKVYCFNNQYGCKDITTLQDLQAHFAECKFKPVSCAFENRGCKVLLAPHEREQHELECQHRMIPCPDCRLELEAYLLEDHAQQCMKKRVVCPNCGQPYYSRKKDRHQQCECTGRANDCVYGCSFKGETVKEMEKHYNDPAAIRMHLSYMSHCVSDLEGKLEEINTEACQIRLDRTMASLANSAIDQGSGSPLTSLTRNIAERLPDFKDPIPESWKCPLPDCGKVVVQAKQTNCGHRVCGSCVEKAFESGAKSVPCPLANISPHGCDECSSGWNKKEIFPDNYARKQVMKLKVYCFNNQYGCDDTPTLQDMQAHFAECKFKPVSCAFENKGCQVLLPPHENERHELECSHRMIPCPDCRQELEACLLEDHAQQCLKKRVVCPDGGQPYYSRKKDKQQRECTSRANDCVYGCSFKGETVKEMEKHYNDPAAIRMHLSYLSRFVSDLEDKLEEANTEVAKLTKDCSDLQAKCRDNERYIWRIQVITAGNCDGIAALKEVRERYVSKDELELDKVNTQRNFRSLTDRIERLQESSGGGSSDVQSIVMQHDRILILHDVRLAEFDQKLQSLDVCSYDGTLVWKIRDYRRKKLDNVHGRTQSICSPPFYTSRFGYKSCAHIYLNGDGTDKGHHMSLYFVLMKGEYDTLLPWPFKQEVTLMLLDQTLARKDLSVTLRPDPNSHFQSPSTKLNLVFGFPKFVALEVLEKDQTYLKDDTIFIRIKVDLEGL